MPINKVVLNSIADDNEKFSPKGFEVASNNSLYTKNNSGNFEWITITDGKVLFGSLTGITTIDVLRSTDTFVSDDDKLMTTKVFTDQRILQINSVTGSDVVTISNSGISTPSPKKSILFGDEVNTVADPFGNPSPGNTRKVIFYDQDRGSFRVGQSDLEFDASNIGDDSFAIGNNNKASGLRSFAFGYNNNISGQDSMVIGGYNNIPGQDVVAIGNYINSKIRRAIILGNEANDKSGAFPVYSQSGKATFVSYTNTNGWANMWLNQGNGHRGLLIDNTLAGFITLKGLMTAVRDTNGEETTWEFDEIWAWTAGGLPTKLNGSNIQLFRAGTTRNFRFQSVTVIPSGAEIYLQVDGNNTENIISTARVDFTLVYRD